MIERAKDSGHYTASQMSPMRLEGLEPDIQSVEITTVAMSDEIAQKEKPPKSARKSGAYWVREQDLNL